MSKYRSGLAYQRRAYTYYCIDDKIHPSLATIPTNIYAVGENQSIVIYFTQTSNGNTPILNYLYSIDGGLTFIAFSPPQTSSPVTINGLTNGTSYTIQLIAVNAIGNSLASSSVSAIPATVPSQPINLTGSRTNTTATISFTQTSNGSSPITNYQYSIDGGSTFTSFSPSQTSSPVTISGLSSTTLSYSIQLIAVNAKGNSSASSSLTVAFLNGSMLFDGTQNLAISGGVNLTNGDFSVEWFQYWNILPPTETIGMFSGVSHTNQLFISQQSPNDWNWQVFGIGSAKDQPFSASQNFGEWHYMVYTIYNNSGVYQYSMYQDGVRTSNGVLTYTNINSPSDFTLTPITTLIGKSFRGYITNFRVVTGQVLYPPSSTTISIPTTNLTQSVGTQLLMNSYYGSNYLQDASPNNLTITVSGTGSNLISTPENPFTPVDRSTFKSLLLPMNSYLIMNPGITFGSTTTPFTVECWFYINVLGNFVIVGSGGTGTNGTAPYPNSGLTVCCISLNQIKIDSSGLAAVPFSFSSNFIQNQWYYFAVSRDNSKNVQMWLGTTPGGTATASTSGVQNLTSSDWNLTSASLLVGAWTNTNSSCNNTFINNLRVTNTNLYNTSLTSIPIPTSNLSVIPGTQLLINNGEFIDQSGTQTFTTVSGITSSSQQPY
jgi:hypothetical protein